MTPAILSTGCAVQCSEPLGTIPPGAGVLAPPVIWPSVSTSCHLPPSGHPARPCHTLPSAQTAPAASWLPDEWLQQLTPGPKSTPLSSPRGPVHPQGLLTEVGGPGTRLGALLLPQRGPPLPAPAQPPPPPPPHPRLFPHPAAAPCLFHQAKDCFLNKSKKLHFLLGKFILSHFISFPPIFFPNNVIK